MPGQLVNLLRVAVEGSLDPAVRQSAAITFKNVVVKGWKDRESIPSPINENDKALVRQLLVQGLIKAPPLVRSQLSEATRTIVVYDYPQKWAGLLHDVLGALSSGDQAAAAGSLRILRLITRKYEFRDDDEERQELLSTINAVFPVLLPLFESLISTESPSLDLAEMLKLVCKSFWSATYMDMPPLMLDQRYFGGWMTALHRLLLKPVPRHQMPEDSDARKSWGWWKMKKWVLHVITRLFDRYADPNLVEEGPNRHFAQLFKEHCVIPFLQGILTLLAELAQGVYFPPRVINLLLHYISAAVAQPETWKVIKPHAPSLALSVAFPLACFNDEDQELWDLDPQEYIRKGYDIMEDMQSPKTAALKFISDLCIARPKGNLDVIMKHIASILAQLQSAGPGAPVSLARQADAAALVIGALLEILKKKKHGYTQQIEPMLLQHVVPMFQSAHGHLRAKACWLSGTCADLKFAQAEKDVSTFATLLRCVIHCLSDKELPVRLDAAVALRYFFEELEVSGSLELLSPVVPQLLQHFLSLSNETDNEDLTMSLESIVEKFPDLVAPYAVSLCAHLAQQFWRMAGIHGEGEEDDDDGEDGLIQAYGVLRAISTVMESIASSPHLFPEIEMLLWPVLERYVSSEGEEVFEELMAIVTCLTYFAPEISPQLWNLYPRIIACLKEWAVDGFDSALLPLDNFISRGTEFFLSNASLLAMTEDVIATTLSGDADAECLACAPKLGSVILENCRGRVDSSVPTLLNIAATYMNKPRDTEEEGEASQEVVDALLVLVADCLYYDCTLALQSMAAAGSTSTLFGGFSKSIVQSRKSGKMVHFRSPREKKIVALGLTRLLTVPAELLPLDLHAPGALRQVAAALSRVLVALRKQELQALETTLGDDDGDDGDEDDFEIDDGDSEVDEEKEGGNEDEDDTLDEDYAKTLERRRALAHRNFELEEESESDDDWWWEEEDDEVSSPLDDISPYAVFATMIDQLKATDTVRYAEVSAGVDPELEKVVMEGIAAHHQQQQNKVAEKVK